MPLQLPVLDDRTFQQLVDEAKARIPRYTSEWTNFNVSDPGYTLLQLHAWLTETILYRLNKLPDLNYIKFLELLNVPQRPAVAARAELTFKLKDLSGDKDPLIILIPQNTQVGVDDPDLTEDLIFETDRTLTALNAALATVIVPGTGDNALDLVTEYDVKKAETKTPHPFFPFGPNPTGNETCLLGILLRPHRQKNKDYSLDRFPECELDLTVFVPQVFEEDANQEKIQGPNSLNCLFPWQVSAAAGMIAWEVYTGTDSTDDFRKDSVWQPLRVKQDDTAAFSRSGHIYLEIPGGMPTAPFRELERQFWEDLGLHKPPTNAAELANDISTGILETEDLTTFDDVEAEVWLDLGYDAAPVPYEPNQFALVWLRARLKNVLDEPPQVSRFMLNTVKATAAVTRIEESIGTSDGRPNQTHTLTRAPILIINDKDTVQPELTLDIIEHNDKPETWNAVADFYGKTAADSVFVLDSTTGTLTFGDGVHGRIPVAGAEIIAREYRYGGGRIGNAGAGTITALRSAIPDVASVTNVRAASGGRDAETLDEFKLRAPHDLRHRERAVTATDFADLAMQTPGVNIERAFALPLTWADMSSTPPTLVPDTPGAVTVVILPENAKQETPQPTEDQLRLVCAHLNDRRLITTELYVIGPRYLELKKLELEVTVGRQFDLKAIQEAIDHQLLTYFHPLQGGEEGHGWPFGQDIFFGNVYRQLLSIEGVRRVLCLEIEPELWVHLRGRLHFEHEAGEKVIVQKVTAGDQLIPTANMQRGGTLQVAGAESLQAGDVLRLCDMAGPTRTEFIRIRSDGSTPSLLFNHPLDSTEIHKVILSNLAHDFSERVLTSPAGKEDALLKLNTLKGLADEQIIRVGIGDDLEYQVIRHVPKVCPDVIEIAEGTLIHLPRTAIDLKVRYEAYG